MSVPLSVTLIQIAPCFFVIEPFLAVICPCGTLQNVVLRFFLFKPPNAQNLLPKIFTKSPISRLVWQTDRRFLGLPGDFLGWPIQ